MLSAAVPADVEQAVKNAKVGAPHLRAFISARTHAVADPQKEYRVPQGNLHKVMEKSATLVEQASKLLPVQVTMQVG
jgi:hypothetical protein